METTAAARANEAAGEMREIEFDAIKDYVICGLCHSIYREPYITILCRHTFCKSCLMIDLFNKQDTRDRNTCPAEGCEAFFGENSDMSMIATADRTLQNIIDNVLFPELAQQDQEAEEAFNRSQRNEDGTKITFRLEPMGDSPTLPRPVLQVDRRTPVKQLKQFIANELHHIEATIEIFCNGVRLGDDQSATNVKTTVWMETQEEEGFMVMTYHIIDNGGD